MIQKTIGLYSESTGYSPFNKDTLVVEVCHQHIVCLVKSETNQNITAFEFFKIELDQNDWEDIFYEVRINSGLMDKSYNNTQIFYHFNEAVLVPAYKYNDSSNEAFLNLIFGESEKAILKTESLQVNGEKIFTVYRIHPALEETIHRNFLSISEHHVYNGILNGVLNNATHKIADCIYVNFYYKHFVVVAVKNKQLQIIQSFDFTTAEDALYYILNISNKFNVSTNDTLLLSGIFETNDPLFKYLQQQFKNVLLTVVNEEQCSLEKLAAYPSHYFSPFFNLQA
jgi:hypothetical protein